MREESNKKSKVFACLLSVQYGIYASLLRLLCFLVDRALWFFFSFVHHSCAALLVEIPREEVVQHQD